MAPTCMTGTTLSSAQPSDMSPWSVRSASLIRPVRSGPTDPRIALKNRKIADAVARCSADTRRWMAAIDGAM